MTMLDRHALSAADWDEAVAGFPDANAYQTSSWARAKGERTSALRVVVRDGGELVAGAQLLVRSIAPGTTAAYVPYGPLIADPHRDDPAVADDIVARLETEALRAGCSVLFVQPSRRDTITESALGRRGFRRAPVAVATTATLEVELGRPEDEIFAGLTKSRRNNVRRARRHGVVIDEGDEGDLVAFHRLHMRSGRHHGFLPMSADYLHRQWQALGRSGQLRLFVARMAGEIRAAGTMLAFGPYAEFKITGWDRSDEARVAGANEAVNWAMISSANAAGHRFFDLGGIPRAMALDARHRGPAAVLKGSGSEFKHGWGGQVAVYPDTYDKVLRPRGHLTYRVPSRLLADHGLGGRVVNWMRRT